MINFRKYFLQKEQWHLGVAHTTIDPRGPGVARLHLVPPKPSLLSSPPSLLIINGTHFLPLGPSWAHLLRCFFDALQRYQIKDVEPDSEDLKMIEAYVIKRVQAKYSVSDHDIINDLSHMVTLATQIANGQPVPSEVFSGIGSMKTYSKSMSAPHRMDLVVSPMTLGSKPICPLNCACCYAQDAKHMIIDKELTTEEWIKIIDACKVAGIPMLTFTGGEPLMRKDIVELVNHAQWFITRLNTSAFMLTEDLAKDLYKASLDGVQITLYATDPTIHDLLVGRPGAFQGTLSGIKTAIKAGLSVSLNTPLTPLNTDLSALIRFGHDLGVCDFGCSGLIPAGGAIAELKEQRALTSHELEAILIDAMATCHDLDVNLAFTSPGWLPEETLRAIGLPSAPVCGACLSNMAITPLGDVVPCQSWLNQDTLGSMLDQPFKQIWHHPTASKIRNQYALNNQCALEVIDHV